MREGHFTWRPEIDADGRSADDRLHLLDEQGSAPTSSLVSSQYPGQKIEDFYECCIRPFVSTENQQSIDGVTFDDLGSLLSPARHKPELRKPEEDRHLRDLLDDMWYESRIDTRSLPQPDHVLDLMKLKPVEAALDR